MTHCGILLRLKNMPSKDKQIHDLENKCSVQARMIDMLVEERNDLQRLYDAQQSAITSLARTSYFKVAQEVVHNYKRVG